MRLSMELFNHNSRNDLRDIYSEVKVGDLLRLPSSHVPFSLRLAFGPCAIPMVWVIDSLFSGPIVWSTGHAGGGTVARTK